MTSRKLTNVHHLPDIIEKALQIDSHRNAGDISVTTLIDAPQIRILKKQHPEIQTDVSDMVFALMGQSVHHVMERADHEDTVKESYRKVISDLEGKKLTEASGIVKSIYESKYPEAESNILYDKTLHYSSNGWILSGTLDRYDKKLKQLQDFKVCSVYAYMNEEARLKWHAQLAIYGYMLKQHGFPVESACIISIFRDWSRTKASMDSSYPQQQVMEIPIPLYPDDKIKEYIDTRILLHQEAEKGNVPDCTGKEKWGSADTFAVKAPNAKRALKVFDNENDAKKWLTDNGHHYMGASIETRKGVNKRCDEWCQVRNVCEQRKREKQQ